MSIIKSEGADGVAAPDLKPMIEAALLAAGRPLTVDDLMALFAESRDKPDRAEVRAALKDLKAIWETRAAELVEVASGFRLQIRKEHSQRISRLWAERPSRYSRALMETLALIAYRQPITRGDIEEVRGVVVSTSIMKTLMEREWVRIVGHREVPGRPALYATTRRFLDDFGIKSLDQLPPLAEIRSLEPVAVDLFEGLERDGESPEHDGPVSPVVDGPRPRNAVAGIPPPEGVAEASGAEQGGAQEQDPVDDPDRQPRPPQD